MRRKSVFWSMPREELLVLCESARSLAEVMRAFGMESKGSNHETLKRRLDAEGIDWRAITERGKSQTGRIVSNLSNDSVMVENSTYSRYGLKRRMIRDGIIPYQCFKCGMEDQWMGEKISLILDHINGVNNDHRKENLRFACPNCASQLDTHAGKNKRRSQ